MFRKQRFSRVHTGIGCGVSMLCLAGYMYQNVLRVTQYEPAVATWFPIMSLFVFYACSTVGYLIVPWVMIGEVFPRQIRGIIGGVATCVGHFSIFAVLQTYPLLQELVTKPGTFAVYGVVSLLSTIFFYCFCPETKGKTLQEIEESFGKNKIKKPIVATTITTTTNYTTATCSNISTSNNNNNNNHKSRKFVFPDIVHNLPKRVPNVVV